MQNSKLIELLKSLNKQEQTDFVEFVESPYFNKNKEVMHFVKLLLTSTSKKESKDPEKEDVYKKIFPGQNFEARKISDLTYSTTLLFENFLSMENIRRDEVFMKLKLLPEALEKNLNRILLSGYQDLIGLLKEYPYKNEELALEHFLLGREQLTHYIKIKSSRRNQAITNKQYYLNAFYVTAKLKLYAQSFRYAVKDGTEPVEYGLEAVLKILDEQPDILEKFSSAAIYRNIINLYIKSEDEKFFYDVLYLEEQEEKYISPDELKDIFKHLIGYCYFKINSGNNKFQFELLSLEKKRLSSGIAYTENLLDEADYEKIFNLALSIGEFQWASDFLQNYRMKLAPEVRNDVYHYCLANYYYETKNFNKAIKSLKNHEFEIERFKIDGKILLLKIYFEAEEEKLFAELVEKLLYQVSHSKQMDDAKIETYTGMIKYAKKLFHLESKLPYQRDRNYKKQVSTLRLKLEPDTQTHQHQWLMQKLIELAFE